MKASRNKPLKGPASARPLDWLLLAMLVMISGSSFVMIRGALASMPPVAIAVIRLWLGAGLMTLIMLIAGRRFPPPLVKTGKGLRLHNSWAAMLLISIVGYTVPFLIFPWAQQFVDSGLAGVYMAFMPVWTVFLAFFFAGESLTPGKIAGFALGLAGALILLGPDVIAGAARSSILAQVGLLFATFCYAASAILMRRTRAIRPRVFAAGTILGAAIFATPALLLADLHAGQWRLASIASVVGLAVGPTGLAGLIIIMIVKRAGAGFMALANYLAPVWAVILGAVIFHERLEPRVFIALALILIGVAASQRRSKARPAPLPLQTEPPQT